MALAVYELTADCNADSEALLGARTGGSLGIDEDAAPASTGRHNNESWRTIADNKVTVAEILQNHHRHRHALLQAKVPVVDIDCGIGTFRSISPSINCRAHVNGLALYAVYGFIALNVGVIPSCRLKSSNRSLFAEYYDHVQTTAT